MSANTRNGKSYAYLPEELLYKILEGTSSTANQLHKFIDTDDGVIAASREKLLHEGLILNSDTTKTFPDLIAVDGATIVEKMTGADLLMSLAVGVEGLPDSGTDHWPGGGEQYYQWQAALPHHVANGRLAQGIMFLMELSILAKATHKVRILDGSHITAILKLNSLLSAHDEEFADENYVEALNYFLSENYEKIIPDIPEIIDDAFSDDGIVALTKYTSSRELLDSMYLSSFQISGDDKSFLSLLLNENEYTKPIRVGQSPREKRQWSSIHIKNNLPLDISEEEAKELNKRLEDSIRRFKIQNSIESSLCFSYYKPYQDGLCYRIELKQQLAENKAEFEKYLNSIKNQIYFPEIHEPYPQYLADIIAKNIAFGMDALKQAIRMDPNLSSAKNFPLLLSYRSK